MASSVASHYQVRWREQGDEGWSNPVDTPVVSEIAVEGLDRQKIYEFQVRAVSSCGAKSVWVGSNYTVPDAPALDAPFDLVATPVADGVALKWDMPNAQASSVDYVVEKAAASGGPWSEVTRVRSLQWTDPVIDDVVSWYRVKAINFAGEASGYSNSVNEAGVSIANLASEVSAAGDAAADAQTDADAALASIADIASDNVLTPSEKPRVIQDRDELVNEQAGIDAQADAYGITTEKAAYDSAITALTSYLAGLTSPTTWNNLAGKTTIVGVTFRQKFVDVYLARQALLNNIYERAKALAGGAPALVNPSFELDLLSWTGGGGTITSVYAAKGAKSLQRNGSVAAPSMSYKNSQRISVLPGQRALLSMTVYASQGAPPNGTHGFYLEYFSAFGGASGSNYIVAPSTQVGKWVTTSIIIEGVEGKEIIEFGPAVRNNTTGISRFDDIEYRLLPNSTAESPFYVGSGNRLGDSRNQAMVTVGNYGSAWSGLSVTYTSTTTSATLTASAATLQSGSVAIAYNQAQVTVSGSAGATVTYYLYYTDPDYSGGSKTLNATTTYINSINNDGRVLVATVTITYPTSGTGGGGGSLPECVSVDAWVVRRTDASWEFVRAGSVAVGDKLRVIDPATGAERWGMVSMSHSAPAECVRVRTESGTTLTCSTTAPLGTRGGQVVAPDAVGQALAERRDGTFGHSPCTESSPVVERMVQHITCENAFFLAGDDPRHLLAHHNLKPDNQP